jgi:hypothetical protein
MPGRKRFFFFPKYRLRRRWRGQRERIEAIIRAMRENRDWTIFLIEHPDNPFDPLPYVDDGLVPINEEDKGPKDLRGISLDKTDLSGVERLAETCFDYARLTSVKFDGCILFGASFRHAKIKRSTFLDAKLSNGDFTKARLIQVSFLAAKMRKCMLRGAVLKDCEFSKVDFSGVEFNSKLSLRFLRDPLNTCKRTRVSGFQQDIREDKFGGIGYDFLSFLRRQDRIDKMWKSDKFLAAIFFIFTDYGRSMIRLAIWIFVIWVLFGAIYAGYQVPNCLKNVKPAVKLLTSLSPDIKWPEKINKKEGSVCSATGSDEEADRVRECFDPYYFSIVTLTTLGFGDIVPMNWKGKILVTVEAMMGYILLAMFASLAIGPGKYG